MHVNFDNLPRSMRDHPCVLWRHEELDGRQIKPPYREDGKSYASSVSPDTWSDYARCKAALQNGMTGEFGLGLILGGRNDDRLVGFDLDDLEKVETQYREASIKWRKRILALATYSEVSPSGTGVHVIARGLLPNNATAYNALKVKFGIEIYAAKRYFTMTGQKREGSPADFVNCQPDIDTLVREIENSTGTMCGDDFDHVDEYTAFGRRADLTDAEVLELARTANKRFSDWADAAWPPGVWSDSNVKVLGDLDKVSALPEQIFRIACALPYVKKSPPATTGETREHKLWRRLAKDLAKLRASNDKLFAERAIERERVLLERPFLESIIEDIGRRTIERKNAEAAALALPLHAVAAATAPDRSSRFSPSAARAIEQLTIASGVDEKYLHESPPPGRIGELVECVAMGMYEPFLKFAIPASLSGLAGITARGLKLADGQGTNIFNLLFAQTSTGKSQSVETFETFLADIRERGSKAFPDGINMPEYFRSIDLISRQGAHKPFQDAPSSCWVEEECWRILDLIINPGKGAGTFSPSDFVNKLFDLSKLNKLHHPPASIRSRGEKELPIANLSQSIYWVTTATNAAKVLGRDVIDTGAASRMIPLLHPGSAGIEHDDLSHRMQTLPTGLRDRMLQLVTRSMDLQVAYNVAAAMGRYSSDDITKLIVTANMDPAAAALFDRNRKALGKFKRGVQDGILDYPSTYIMFSRIAMLSQRIAAQIAYFNSDSATITHEALAWATGHLAQRIGTFLTAFDRGDMGEALEDGEMTILKAVKDLLGQGKGDATGFVAFADLSQRCRNRSPFSKDRKGATREIRSHLDMMEREKMIAKRDVSTGTNVGTFYAMTSHKCWQSIM